MMWNERGAGTAAGLLASRPEGANALIERLAHDMVSRMRRDHDDDARIMELTESLEKIYVHVRRGVLH